MTMRLACLVVFAVCCAQGVCAQVVGRVLVAAGEVTAQRAGKDVALTAGAAIENRDLIRLGEGSNAQIRFNDDSIVALRSKTEFRIDDYAFSGNDDTLSKAFFSLLRGGLRTITGLIGRNDRAKYHVKTQSATVGIRGTSYALVVCRQDCIEDGSVAPDGDYGEVFEGRVSVGNEGGEQEYGADEAFFVANIRTAPKPLLTRPGFLRDRLEARARLQQRAERVEMARADQPRHAAGADAKGPLEQRPGQLEVRPVAGGPGTGTAAIGVTDLRDDSGNVAVLGPGLGAGVSWAAQTQQRADVDGGRGTVIGLDAQTHAFDRFILNVGGMTGDRSQAAILDSGKIEGDGGMIWGRWAPGALITLAGNTFAPPTGVHFLFGNLTPPSALPAPFATTTALQGTIQYDYVGGPRPTDGQGNAGTFLAGTFIVNFLDRTLGGGVEYQAGGITYKLPVPLGTSLVAGSGFVGFGINARNAGSWSCATCNSGTIGSYSVSGLFMGSRAQGLGVTFATLDAQAGRSAGAAAFRCRGTRC